MNGLDDSGTMLMELGKLLPMRMKFLMAERGNPPAKPCGARGGGHLLSLNL